MQVGHTIANVKTTCEEIHLASSPLALILLDRAKSGHKPGTRTRCVADLVFDTLLVHVTTGTTQIWTAKSPSTNFSTISRAPRTTTPITTRGGLQCFCRATSIALVSPASQRQENMTLASIRVAREHGFGIHEVRERRKSSVDVRILSIPSRRNENRLRCMRVMPLEQHSSSGTLAVFIAIPDKLRLRQIFVGLLTPSLQYYEFLDSRIAVRRSAWSDPRGENSSAQKLLRRLRVHRLGIHLIKPGDHMATVQSALEPHSASSSSSTTPFLPASWRRRALP